MTSIPWRRLAAALLAVLLFACGDSPAQRAPAAIPEVVASELPQQARDAIALIKKGGPFPYERDGIEFRNREKLLPMKARGYYREYTVQTRGARDRGARRMVAGGCADGAAGRSATTGAQGGAARSSPRVFAEACGSAEYYYSDDHYRSFRRIREQGP